jgi:hypothetical protein
MNFIEIISQQCDCCYLPLYYDDKLFCTFESINQWKLLLLIIITPKDLFWKVCNIIYRYNEKYMKDLTWPLAKYLTPNINDRSCILLYIVKDLHLVVTLPLSVHGYIRTSKLTYYLVGNNNNNASANYRYQKATYHWPFSSVMSNALIRKGLLSTSSIRNFKNILRTKVLTHTRDFENILRN